MADPAACNILTYEVSDAIPYINWLYFFHAWGFQPRYAGIAQVHDCEACRSAWLAEFADSERQKAIEASKLHRDAMQMLARLSGQMKVKCLYRLLPANADGDDLMIGGTRLPLLRQQSALADGKDCFLCLSDFVRPLSGGVPDTVGVFAASVSDEGIATDDAYNQLLVQTLADRLVEAGVEKMHQEVRKVSWGYVPDEDIPIAELLQDRYQGIRPAVGYPSLPDQSVCFILDSLLGFSQIGITLTENGAMHPHASSCGLMLSHPQARYFAIGKIGADQLTDYARRRGLPVEVLRKFLNANLS